MDEQLPEDIEDLLHELEDEYGDDAPLPPDVEDLLRVLRSERLFGARRVAAEKLGKLETSHPQIVQALITACESDPSDVVSRAAVRSLRSPVHQALLAKHPDLRAESQRALQPRPDAERQDTLPQQPSADAEQRARKKPESNLRLVAQVAGALILLAIGASWASRSSPWGVGLILVSAFLLGWALWIWRAPASRRNRYLRSTRRTSGVVAGTHTEEHGAVEDRHTSYHAKVFFQAVDAQDRSRSLVLRLEVPRRIWKTLEPGRSVDVRYAQEDPRIALIEDEGLGWLPFEQ